MDTSMKKLVGCVVVMTLLFSLSAFAATGSGKIELGVPTLVAGKELPKGEYKLTWAGEGKDVQVTLTSADKRTTVTAPAKIVEGAKARMNQVVRNGDGSLKEIWFGGKAQSLAFCPKNFSFQKCSEEHSLFGAPFSRAHL
jgi:hypothetical protein